MSQTDGIIANASGAAVRQDLNNALQALLSNSSGATAPATTYSYQFWADTTAGQLKQRNSANDAWIVVAELDGIEENLVLRNKTAEDFDNGRESIISFEGTQSGGEVSTLSSVEGNHSGTADDTKGRLVFKTNNGSTLTTALTIDDEQKAKFNLAPSVDIELNSNNNRAIIDFNVPTGIGSIATQEILASENGLTFATPHAAFSTSVSGTLRTETAVAVTSGSLVEFNNLPYWAKRISIVAYEVSFSIDLANLAIRVKTSNGAVTGNYRITSVASFFDGTVSTISPTASTTAVVYPFGQASSLRDFVHTFTTLNEVPSNTLGQPNSSTVWVSTGTMGGQFSSPTGYGVVTTGGVVNALGAVTGVQILPTTVATFTSGTMTVICEG
jgi:hypothetical protein